MLHDRQIADRMALETNAGYWKVNDKYFFDKSACLRYATSIKNLDVTFHFFDDFYAAIDWNTEVNLTLDELYCQRARQLREKYDYLIIQFSGGSDSRNILDTFLKNNIKVDEIVTHYPVSAVEKLYSTFDRNSKSAKNLAFEYKEAAEPKLKEVAQTNPEIKITVLDYTETCIELCLNNSMHLLPMSGVNNAPSLAGHHMLGKLIRERAEYGKVACIAGIDKPRMAFVPRTKNIVTWFDDISTPWGNYAGNPFGGFQPKIEYFYYTVDFPDIWKKQCQILKRTMAPIVNADVRPEFYKNLHWITERGAEIFKVHENFFKKMLYPSSWDETIYQAGKPSSYWYAEASAWFFDSHLTDNRTKEYYAGQLNEYISGIDQSFIVRQDGRPIRFKELASNPIVI